MKKILLLFLGSYACTFTQAQTEPTIVKQAIIHTTTTIVAPEDDEDDPAVSNMTGAQGENIRIVRLGGDGETKTVTTILDHVTKTTSQSEMGNNTTIRDNLAKKTTTLMEIMGNRTGFWATDAEMEENRKRMDSMIQQNPMPGMRNPATPATDFKVSYQDGQKKVAGVLCAQAQIVLTYPDRTDTVTVWYHPGVKFEYLRSTGGALGGFGPQITTSNNSKGLSAALQTLKGFPMLYETKMPRGRKMRVEVTKLLLDKPVTEKDFQIPSDYEVKPLREMENGGMGNMQIRVRG